MFRRLFLLLAFVAFAFAFAFSCPKVPITSNKNCPFGQALTLILSPYSTSNNFTALNGQQIFCEDVAQKQDDKSFLFTGDLPFNGTKFIVFSGTQFSHTSDILADLSMEKVYNSYIGLSVMQGFNSKFLAWKNAVDNWVSDCEDDTIILGGHSLGGAVAHLMGLYLSKQKNCNVKIVTAGEPGALYDTISDDLAQVPHLRFVTYSSHEHLFKMTNHHMDAVVSLPAFKHLNCGSFTELPLYQRDLRHRSSHFQNNHPSGLHLPDINLHHGCSYMQILDQSLCRGNMNVNWHGW